MVPQLPALGAVLYITFRSGALEDAAGPMCCLPLAALILVVMLVGAAAFKPKEEPPAPTAACQPAAGTGLLISRQTG